MSLCTLIPNQDRILQYYYQIDRIGKSYDSGWRLVGYILSDLIKTQWDLRRKYYNKNMLDKHKFEISVTGKEYLNCLFQHIYNHGHSALTDEVFEVQEAKDAYYQFDRESGHYYDLPNNYYEKPVEYTKDTLSLWVEELIDCLFFIIESTSWIETHFQLMLDNQSISNKTINYYLNEYNDFSDRISIMIEEEGPHITTYIYDHKDIIKTKQYDELDLLLANREFLRTTAWKDWKEFKDDYYNPGQFGEMFKANRKLYLIILNMLFNVLNDYAKNVLNIENYDQQNHISDMFKVIYAVFKTKAEENERRQLEDPRYKINNTGSVVGVDI